MKSDNVIIPLCLSDFGGKISIKLLRTAAFLNIQLKFVANSLRLTDWLGWLSSRKNSKMTKLVSSHIVTLEIDGDSA